MYAYTERERTQGHTGTHSKDYSYFFLMYIMYVIHYIYVGRNKKVVT